MQQSTPQVSKTDKHLLTVLDTQVQRITKELKNLVEKGDWEAVRSILRVLDAHARARELREQGQPARAHLWLVGITRKRQEPQPTGGTFVPPESA